MSATVTKAEIESLFQESGGLRYGTAIGADVGQRSLLTLAPGGAGPEITETFSTGGRGVAKDYAALESRRGDCGPDEAVMNGIETRIASAAADAIGYARSFDAPPVLVLEDSPHPTPTLADCLADGKPVACWLLGALQESLVAAARGEGVPVAVVPEWRSTTECHICKERSKLHDRDVVCRNDECPVGRADRDESAAVTLANRLG